MDSQRATKTERSWVDWLAVWLFGCWFWDCRVFWMLLWTFGYGFWDFGCLDVDPGIAWPGHLVDMVAAGDPWFAEFGEEVLGDFAEFVELYVGRVGAHVVEDGFNVSGHDASYMILIVISSRFVGGLLLGVGEVCWGLRELRVVGRDWA